MVNSSNLKKGYILEVDGAPWLVIEVSFQAPSARGASTLTNAKIKSLITGNVLKKSWRGGEMLPEADCEKREIQYLYNDGSEFHFMDEESYDQFALSDEVVGELSGFMLDGMRMRSMLYNGEVVSIELPNTVELEVVDTTPNLKGATAQAQLKPATLETGLVIQVPPYLENGVKIKVDTRDGRFIERVK